MYVLRGGATPDALEAPLRAQRPRLEVSGVSKTYGSARVLTDVRLQLAPGEIHALVGQNGSGKSTLIRILSGVVNPDEGATVLVDGTPLDLPTRPKQLLRHGVSFVHQDLGLIEDASVVENIRMGQLRRHPFTRHIRWAGEVERAAETLRRLRCTIDPRMRLGDLKQGQRGLVAIARALQAHEPGRGLIVFDESTQSLPRESLAEFYATVKELAAEGTGVLIVSHRLDEVLHLADRITVLRDGVMQAGGLATAGLGEADLAAIMLGREVELDELTHRTPAVAAEDRPADASSIQGAQLCGRDLAGFSFRAAPGQVIGVTGATDAGHEELAAALGGATTGVSGTVTIGGTELDLHRSTVADHLAAGIAFVPEQRAREGLVLEMSALENLTLPRTRRKSSPLLLRRGWQHDEFNEAVALLGISPPSPQLLVKSFSGGNQQKILVAKWLLERPQLLVLHEPTQAVDVGARVDILRAVRAAADSGALVVICSVEAQDLAYVCDEVVVMRNGRESAHLTGSFEASDILAAL